MAKSLSLTQRVTVTEMPIEEINVDVDVVLTKRFKFRLWLGRQLIMLLARLWTAEFSITCVSFDNEIGRHTLEDLRDSFTEDDNGSG